MTNVKFPRRKFLQLATGAAALPARVLHGRKLIRRGRSASLSVSVQAEHPILAHV